MKILVIEDEIKVAAFIKKGLEEEFYSVDAVYDGREGLRLAVSDEYDLLIIDIMLPYKDGISIIKELRAEKINTPVLLLTAKDGIHDRVVGLDSGADDYMTKPFSFVELLARVRALLRRHSPVKSLQIKIADLVLDTQSHKVHRGDKEIILTVKEYEILEYLLRNKDKVISRTLLSEHVYGYHFSTETNVIDVHINKLRNKIDKGFKRQLIYSVRGVGYQIKEI